MNILQLRLQNQKLTSVKASVPEDIVNELGAVQAQDYPAAKWSLGLRLRQPSDTLVEHALNEGRILRTHILRPTWHFVSPEDIQNFLALTAPRIQQQAAHYNKRLELTADILKKTNKIITNALKGRHYLTRQEIKAVLAQHGIETDAQRLGHIVMNAELEALIVNGPRKGKQFTYALLEERIPKTRLLSGEATLARLAEKYFTSHGPAQLKDFAWWAGLTKRDATKGLEMIRSKLTSEKVREKTYWLPHHQSAGLKNSERIFLLSVYDEYFISYTDRSELYDDKYKNRLPIGNALLTSLIIIDGKVAGTWKHKIKKESIEIQLFPFEKLKLSDRETIEVIVKKYGDFFDSPVVIS